MATGQGAGKGRPGRITVCLGEELRAEVEERARAADDRPSTWIKKLIARYLRGELEPVKRHVA